MEDNKTKDVEASAANATPTVKPEMQSVTISVNRESNGGGGPSILAKGRQVGSDLSISGLALLGFLAWIGWKMVCIGNDTFEFCMGEFLFLSGIVILSVIVLHTTRTFYNNIFDDGIHFNVIMLFLMDAISILMIVAYVLLHGYYTILVYCGGCHGEKTVANEMTAVIGLTVLAIQWIIIIVIIVAVVLSLFAECYDEFKRRRQTNYSRMPANAQNVV